MTIPGFTLMAAVPTGLMKKVSELQPCLPWRWRNLLVGVFDANNRLDFQI